MRKTLLFLLLFLFSLLAYSKQDNDTTKACSSSYFDISGGLTIGSLRDMNTSPLFYTGVMPAVQIKYSNHFSKNIIALDFNTYNGLYMRSVGDVFSSGSANIFDFELLYYRNYDEYAQSDLGQWPGFSISNSTALRVNSDFGNAAYTMDNISSLNLNYMITKKWTRSAKEKKFLWLFKYTRKRKDYLLSFKAGVPIYSVIYRPGFTNPGNATQPDLLLPGYEFSGKVFSGMNTKLSISRILKNGNMFKLSYNWDLFTTGKHSLNRLDSSKHTILFSLVFKIK